MSTETEGQSSPVRDELARIIGHVWNEENMPTDDANEACVRATEAGRPWHALSRGFAVTISPNHYATEAAARAAVVDAADRIDWAKLDEIDAAIAAELGEDRTPPSADRRSHGG